MLKCDECDREATYDSPQNFCDEHWFDWWAEVALDGATPAELAAEKKNFLESIAKTFKP
jgi:hypothetical protein